VFDRVFVWQFKKSRTDTQTHRAYKELEVPPFNLTVNVGNDKLDHLLGIFAIIIYGKYSTFSTIVNTDYYYAIYYVDNKNDCVSGANTNIPVIYCDVTDPLLCLYI